MQKVYMFKENGQIQFWEEDDISGMILAPTHELANQFVAWTARNRGRKIDIVEVGKAKNGETLSERLAASQKAGANAAFIIDEINQDEVDVLPMISALKQQPHPRSG